MKIKRSVADQLVFEGLTATAAEINTLHSSGLTAAEQASVAGRVVNYTVTFAAGPSTRAVSMTSTTAVNVRFSPDGAAATSADVPLAVGDVLQAPIAKLHTGAGVQVYAV